MNFAKNPINEFKNEDIINSGNFSQIYPNTEILVGLTLTINGGNWVNVKPQPGWTINGGNWAQISRCSHLHPATWFEHGLIECALDCQHCIDIVDVIIDGVTLDTIYKYEDLVVKTGHEVKLEVGNNG